MDKNNMYLAIGGTAIVAALVIVGMVLASGYAGTMTNLQAGTQNSLDSISDRLNALKVETDQLNATASLNLIRTDALAGALDDAAEDLSDQISSGNTNTQNTINAVNNSLSDQLNDCGTDIANNLDAVNSSLYNQMNALNANITGSLNVINAGLSTQLTNVYNSLHSELSSAYSSIIGSINSMNSNMNAQFSNLNGNLSAVNASVISQINAINNSLSDLLISMNMSLQDYLELMQGNLTDLEQKLWSADDSVKNDTKLIQTIIDDIGTMNSSINAQLASLDSQTSEMPRTLTKSGMFTILNQTTVPDGEDHLTMPIAQVFIFSGAADFKLSLYIWIDDPSNDISDADNDNFQVAQGIGDPRVYSFPIYVTDGDLGGIHEIEFTGSYMSMTVILHGTVQEDIEIYYSYTVTTSNDATIWNINPDPPVP